MLQALGIDVISSRDFEILGRCPGHKERTGREDHNPSWWFNFETGAHICFSCGYKGSLTSLVIEQLDFHTGWGLPDYDRAKEWIQSWMGDDLEAARRRLSRASEYQGPTPKPVPMSEARLNFYDNPPQWALDARALTAEACAHYKVKWDSGEDSWITPIRDPDDFGLWGWQVKGQREKIFRNRPAGIKKSKTLFGVDVFTGGTMIVVESPLDAVRIKSAGIDGAVSTFGALISNDQVALMHAKADRIILAMDNPSLDSAGAKAVEAFRQQSRKLGFGFSLFEYGHSSAKDVGEMTDRQILRGIEDAKSSILKGALL